ncbi:hypothetical protein PG993_008239 [Apiospora rasikravindrae]|uniref:Uncharacterized protein n=1 Tax=Apiospora rasikravindrae TaxID=990691 RepID=A0ABR1T252_9PEZI
MELDDGYLGAGAAAPEPSSAAAAGKTVEDVVVQDAGAGDGAGEDKPPATLMDVDMADENNAPGTPGPSKDAPGNQAEEKGGHDSNGPFSHVDNAIEASIREAMATSMHDDAAPVARSETTLEGGSTSSVHRKAKEMADYDKMDLDASERSFPSTGRTLSRESVSVSDVASGAGPPPPAAA